jgi:hypothetical protein
MKEIEFYAGETIENAWKTLLKESADCGETCYGTFNDKQILSTDTLDEAYKKVTGLTKTECDERLRKEHEEYKRQEEEFLASVPSKTEEYKNAARGVIREDEYEYWDKIVPIRLKDLYHGMELDATLDICRIMRDESVSLEKRIEKAKQAFNEQGHSGMSAGLTLAMIKKFCPNGEQVVLKLK